MDFATFDPSSDAYKMNVIGFLFRTGHNVHGAFKMLKQDFSTITYGEVQNAFLALKLEGIPVPINNSVVERACLPGMDPPTLDKILRILPAADLKNMRLVSRGFNGFIDGMDLVLNKVLIHLNASSVQLVVSRIGKIDIINVSEANQGSAVEINGVTAPSDVLFVEQGIKEFENVIERRNKKVEELRIEFESEYGEAEDAHDAHRNEFFRRIGETLARLEPHLMCNDLIVKVRTPLDLLPIFANFSSENFIDLAISSHRPFDVFFEMRDVVELPQWRKLRYLSFDELSSLSLADITHIPDADICTRSQDVESIMKFVETCRNFPNKLSHTIRATIDTATLAQRLQPLGIQRTIGGNIKGRIPLQWGGYISYEIRDGLWKLQTVLP
ncbi:unnamed protein product [Caenorhabditis nigoni]